MRLIVERSELRYYAPLRFNNSSNNETQLCRLYNPTERAAPSGAFFVSLQFHYPLSMLPQSQWAPFIKRRAAELGFMACGISKAEFLERKPRASKPGSRAA